MGAILKGAICTPYNVVILEVRIHFIRYFVDPCGSDEDIELINLSPTANTRNLSQFNREAESIYDGVIKNYPGYFNGSKTMLMDKFRFASALVRTRFP